MKITYWSDYACPYCYIGETGLRNVIKDMPEFKDEEVEFKMKVFQLDPYVGAQPPEYMKSALLKAMEKESSKVDESQGMTCGPLD